MASLESEEAVPQKAAQARTPKNGRYFVALLAGGPRDLYDMIREKLAAMRNTSVAHHWDAGKPRAFDGVVPRDVDFVIGLKDFVSHNQLDKTKRAAKLAGVRMIVTTRKYVRMAELLSYHGFPLADKPLAIDAPESPEPTAPPEWFACVPDPEPDARFAEEETPIDEAAQAPPLPRTDTTMVPTVEPANDSTATRGPSTEADTTLPDTLFACALKMRQLMRQYQIRTVIMGRGGQELNVEFDEAA